jgi:hypothetical protein
VTLAGRAALARFRRFVPAGQDSPAGGAHRLSDAYRRALALPGREVG